MCKSERNNKHGLWTGMNPAHEGQIKKTDILSEQTNNNELELFLLGFSSNPVFCPHIRGNRQQTEVLALLG